MMGFETSFIFTFRKINPWADPEPPCNDTIRGFRAIPLDVLALCMNDKLTNDSNKRNQKLGSRFSVMKLDMRFLLPAKFLHVIH